MLFRFSLYGFLKNQQYYDPFLILAFLQKGLSFFMIGVLIAFREIFINLFEIPSGAIADLYGRRKCMILSFCAYIVSFAIFGLARTYWLFFPAMLFFAIGEAFRTGTHKAMIFTWLQFQGRSDQKTRVYGYTRSWSKFGSAVSVVIAAVFVLVTNDYVLIFYLSMIPYLLAIINFLGYPEELDGRCPGSTLAGVFRYSKTVLLDTFRRPALRRLMLESMGFEGIFKATRDYLQPILESAALPLTAMLALSSSLDQPQKAALLVGPVYFVLYLLSAMASRNAHRFVPGQGGEDAAARRLWFAFLLLFAVMLPAMLANFYPLMILSFVGLFVLQNFWRPILISRIDRHGSEESKATLLSVENQAKSLSTMFTAPLLGLAVDWINSGASGPPQFYPVGLVGLVVAGGFLLTSSRKSRSS
jgi:MFS family permease